MESRTERVRATDSEQNGGLSQAGKRKTKTVEVLMKGKGENRRRR